MEIYPREGVMKEETFPNTCKHSHQQVCWEFWNLRGQHNLELKKEKPNPQNTCLTTTPSGELAQMIMSTTSKWELKKEAQVACLG